MRPVFLRVMQTIVLGLALACAAPAIAKSYTAERFDVLVRVQPDGTLDVTETVVFRFEDGTFREVWRDIPTRRTDGIEIVSAAMQGRTLPFGNENGTAEVTRRGSRMRVLWRFTPLEGVTREFRLNYRAQGVARQGAAADVLAWRALPIEHTYRIKSSTVVFELPRAPIEMPDLSQRRVEQHLLTNEGRRFQIQLTDVGRNGWIEASFAFPPATLVSAPPQWQQRDQAINARASMWIVGAAALVVVGFVVVLALRQSYDRPPDEIKNAHAEWHQQEPPDDLPPAIGAIIAANGRGRLEHAMSIVLALADRGEIEIEERARGSFGHRDFTVKRRGRSLALTPYEQVALDTIFKGRSGEEREVSLSRARNRMTWKFSAFSKALTNALASAGLLDASRKAVRDRYTVLGIALLVLAGLAVIPAAILIQGHGAWPMLIPGAFVLVAVCSFIFAAATTPLSNDGLRRAARWRAYRKHLAAVAQGKGPSPGVPPAGALPYAVALGLADSWSKFLKRHGHSTPPWFHSLPDDRSAFAAFVASGGAGATSGGATAGGAAGGGSSGAH